MKVRPNIVFLLTDDQRYDTIRALGNRVIRTPNMDWLVRQGTAFTHACIPGGTSGAVCMPSRAMIHTGRTLFHVESAGQQIPESHRTLGETFRAAGYATHGVGKWHNAPSSYHRSFTDGAEIFFGGMADHWNVPSFRYDPTGRYGTVLLQTPEPFRTNKTVSRACDHIHAGCHSTDIISQAGVTFIERQRVDVPYLLYLSFLAPHDPRTMPKRYLDLYPPEAMELPPSYLGGHPFDNGELQIRDELLAAFPRTPEEIRRHQSEYYAMITHLDDAIGHVIEAVRARGQLDRTIFVLAGDNGLAVGRHGLMGKQSLYDHSIRVPLLFAGPGVPRNVRTDALVYLMDIFPTLCSLTGLRAPGSVEGLNLVPAMRRSGAGGRDALYLAYTDKHRGIRTCRWKLIEYVVNGRHSMTQLFDLEQDPWEMRNLAGEHRHAKTVRFLKRHLLCLRDVRDDRRSPWGKTFWKGWGENLPR